MRTHSAGQVLKGAALFTIGQELTKKAISVVKKKYNEMKDKQVKTEEEVKDGEDRAKLDED